MVDIAGAEPATAPTPEALTLRLLGAMRHRDAEAMGDLVADDLIFVTVDNGVIGKADYIAIYTDVMEVKAFELRELQAVVRGGVASTTYVLHLTSASGDAEPWRPTLRMSDTWVFEVAAWRLLARHATEML